MTGRRQWFYCVAGATLVGLAAGCHSPPASLMPVGMGPLPSETAEAWVAALVPTRAKLYDLRWTYRTQRGTMRGRAAVRLAPPDSMRFDYRGPFGRSGAAFIVGYQVIWAQPEEDVGGLVPVAPLFWAALGIPRGPPPGWEIRGREENGRRIWEYVRGGDRLGYVVEGLSPLRLQAELRRFDTVIGTVEAVYGDSIHVPVRATITFPLSASQFFFTVVNVETIAELDREVWKRP